MYECFHLVACGMGEGDEQLNQVDPTRSPIIPGKSPKVDKMDPSEIRGSVIGNDIPLSQVVSASLASVCDQELVEGSNSANSMVISDSPVIQHLRTLVDGIRDAVTFLSESEVRLLEGIQSLAVALLHLIVHLQYLSFTEMSSQRNVTQVGIQLGLMTSLAVKYVRFHQPTGSHRSWTSSTQTYSLLIKSILNTIIQGKGLLETLSLEHLPLRWAKPLASTLFQVAMEIKHCAEVIRPLQNLNLGSSNKLNPFIESDTTSSLESDGFSSLSPSSRNTPSRPTSPNVARMTQAASRSSQVSGSSPAALPQPGGSGSQEVAPHIQDPMNGQ
jgi:hypothetical protein